MRAPPFFDGFHQLGLGPKPASQAQKAAQGVRQLDKHCITHLEAITGQLLEPLFAPLPSSKRAMLESSGKRRRMRIFTTTITFWIFLFQVMDVEASCRRALSKFQALAKSRGFKGVVENTDAYCRARARLPIRLLLRVLHVITGALQRTAYGRTQPEGRTLVLDGTEVTLQDSDENRNEFGYANGQSPGVGFPTMKALGLFDLASCACLKMSRAKNKAGDPTMAERLIGQFKPGDTLIADRAFCSFTFIAKLKLKGVQIVMRLHPARARKLQREGKVEPGSITETWSRPPSPPVRKPFYGGPFQKKYRETKAAKKARKQMEKAAHLNLPSELQMRIVCTKISLRGHRPKPVYFATTLLDEKQYPDEKIAAMYLQRWNVELFFDDLKTSQNAQMLRTMSPHMVAREWVMHLIAYNLSRLLMAEAQQKRVAEGEAVRRLSYRGTLDRVSQSHPSMWAVPSKVARDGRAYLVGQIAADPILDRPGRREPRQVKRRPKNFQLMTQPRPKLRARPEGAKRSTYKAA